MCDYSLHSVASRPAKVGDKLTTTRFAETITKGFAAVDDCGTAVCLLPGTELAFDDDIVEGNEAYWSWFSTNHYDCRTAKFTQVNMDNPYTHHDSIEMPDGKKVLISNLREGQTVTVLQLPVELKVSDEFKQVSSEAPLESISNYML